jgi:hypothetical protein
MQETSSLDLGCAPVILIRMIMVFLTLSKLMLGQLKLLGNLSLCWILNTPGGNYAEYNLLGFWSQQFGP